MSPRLTGASAATPEPSGRRTSPGAQHLETEWLLLRPLKPVPLAGQRAPVTRAERQQRALEPARAPAESVGPVPQPPMSLRSLPRPLQPSSGHGAARRQSEMSPAGWACALALMTLGGSPSSCDEHVRVQICAHARVCASYSSIPPPEHASGGPGNVRAWEAGLVLTLGV